MRLCLVKRSAVRTDNSDVRLRNSTFFTLQIKSPSSTRDTYEDLLDYHSARLSIVEFHFNGPFPPSPPLLYRSAYRSHRPSVGQSVGRRRRARFSWFPRMPLGSGSPRALRRVGDDSGGPRRGRQAVVRPSGDRGTMIADSPVYLSYGRYGCAGCFHGTAPRARRSLFYLWQQQQQTAGDDSTLFECHAVRSVLRTAGHTCLAFVIASVRQRTIKECNCVSSTALVTLRAGAVRQHLFLLPSGE